MIFIWGDKLFGTVYQVPGVCHVATVFFHIFFFPLIPRRTYIVVDGASAAIEEAIARGTIRPSVYGFWGIRIPMSARSVLLGYFRGILGLLIVIGLMIASVPIIDAMNGTTQKGHGPWNPTSLVIYGIILGSGILFWTSRRLTRASEPKAGELLGTLGLAGRSSADEPA